MVLRVKQTWDLVTPLSLHCVILGKLFNIFALVS